jgi:hypothetical protein
MCETCRGLCNVQWFEKDYRSPEALRTIWVLNILITRRARPYYFFDNAAVLVTGRVTLGFRTEQFCCYYFLFGGGTAGSCLLLRHHFRFLISRQLFPHFKEEDCCCVAKGKQSSFAVRKQAIASIPTQM